MGKSSKAKIVRRLKQSRAKLMQPLIDTQAENMNNKLKLSAKGFAYREKVLPNAFLEPDNPEAVFP